MMTIGVSNRTQPLHTGPRLSRSGPVSDFISSEEWPSASPDLNLLDYDLWSKLETIVCSKPHTCVEVLKKSLLKAWANFPIESLRAAIDRWPARLRECVKAKGGKFEE